MTVKTETDPVAFVISPEAHALLRRFISRATADNRASEEEGSFFCGNANVQSAWIGQGVRD
jgi:hypothetical protein